MELIDTHCHLNDSNLSVSIEAAIANAKQSGVVQLIVPGMDLATSALALQIARDNPTVCYPAIGVHPHEVVRPDFVLEATVDRVRDLAAQPGVKAIGEIGIDYHHHTREETGAVQREAFGTFLQLAVDHNLPALVHGRSAYDDVLAVAGEFSAVRGVLHSFDAPYETAKAALDRGWLISLTAIITYRDAERLRDVVRQLPLDRLMLETDTPYLPPQSVRDAAKVAEAEAKRVGSAVLGTRGRNNQPAFVLETAEVLAQLLDTDLERVATVTTKTARDFFGLTTA